MDLKLFLELWRSGHPDQVREEWLPFIEFTQVYFMNREIFNPIVVEIGVEKNRQKKFYEKFINAHHIGIDISDKYAFPDILGNSHNIETLKTLKSILNGKLIDLLFINGDHHYNSVKLDYEIYEPLTRYIIAIHDIQFTPVKKFWNELYAKKKDLIKVTYKEHCKDRGIGMLIRKLGIKNE